MKIINKAPHMYQGFPNYSQPPKSVAEKAPKTESTVRALYFDADGRKVETQTGR